MDRPKVPTKHEAKKGYFVALREAFLVWDKDRMQELEDLMRGGGMTDDKIKNARYFNASLFKGCINRHVPPPSTLYWRVRAVFAMYGSIIDSKTNKPLFNAAAWKKANRVLKEILLGYYSDPPGMEMYTKKLKPDESVKRNKYGMEVIECMRGTNRTEAFHKNLMMTFRGWQTGVRMFTCLLAERRHRHNHRCSELRRLGFPIVGHFDTWLIDQLQNLVMQNRGSQLFPDWSNASDYKTTNESFDTIALHSAEVHDAIKSRWENGVDKASVKLTDDQSFMCRVMGVDLPFLPFSTDEERKQFALCVLDPNFPDRDEDAAIAWCNYVDGKVIFPKLPVHIRNYRERFERNERVKQSVENARAGNEKLAELNAALTCLPIEGRNAIREPHPIPDPLPQALHAEPYVEVGGIAVGETPYSVPKRGQRGADKRKRSNRRCKLCSKYGSPFFDVCSGRTGRGVCKFFTADGAQILCQSCNRDTCMAWNDGERVCHDTTPVNA